MNLLRGSPRRFVSATASTAGIIATIRRAPSLIRDDDAIVVTARNSAGRLILSDARLQGKRIDVIVDTGAQTSVGNLALQKMVADRRANRLPFVATELSAVSGEAVPAIRTAIKRIVINGIDVNDLNVSFADSQAFRALGLHERPALLLGMGTVAAPLLVMQPAMGAGFFASKTPTPLKNCLRSLANHSVFGLGLFLAAVLLGWATR